MSRDTRNLVTFESRSLFLRWTRNIPYH